MAMSKILVIDDEPWLREMIRQALIAKEFEVIEAVDNVDGDAKAREHLPDLILCDINMAGKSDAGYLTLAKLREDAVTAAIPFILMTGMADAAGMRHGMELGADDYLPKPFKVDELYAAVNARLRKAQTVRAEAEKKLSLLRSQISLMMPHEMRTPLNGIISNAELLAESAASLDPKTIAEMSREICQSAQRLERLIGNFLIHAQLEIIASDAEKITSLRTAQNVHAADIARDVAIAQADQAGRAQDLVLQLADVPVAMAQDYFRKIVSELVQNAFKFSENGRRVNVSLSGGNGQIEFSVHDAGCGFSVEQIQHIGAYLQFERKMEDRQGLGLGLAIVKKLAELHNGTLIIASAQGAGSTVTVKLPLAAA
jgi:two-component system, sensor histidine kinase and response regulator